MKLRAYSIYDNKVMSFNAPFYAATDGAAVRSFQDLAQDLNTSVGRHPRDYSLFCVGEFDDTTGYLEAKTPREFIVEAHALVGEQPQLPLAAQ